MTRRMSLTRCRAFTLVELLVVITIIGLLLALMMPALSGVLDYADALRCRSNLRGLAQAILTYSSQHRGIILPAGYRFDRDGNDLKSGSEGRPYWCNILVDYAYVQSPDTAPLGSSDTTYASNIFRCPSGVDVNLQGWAIGDNPAALEVMGFVRFAFQRNLEGWDPGGTGAPRGEVGGVDCWYYYNADTWREDYPSNRLPPDTKTGEQWAKNPHAFYTRLSQIKDRTTMVMLCDGVGMNGERVGSNRTRIGARHPGDYGRRTVTNMAFWDGHVEPYQWAYDCRQDPLWDNALKMSRPPYFRLSNQ